MMALRDYPMECTGSSRRHWLRAGEQGPSETGAVGTKPWKPGRAAGAYVPYRIQQLRSQPCSIAKSSLIRQ